MQQWIVQIAYEGRGSPRKVAETMYMPSEQDVRDAVRAKGGHVLSIRSHSRTPLERLLARMTFCSMSRALLVQMNGLGLVLW